MAFPIPGTEPWDGLSDEPRSGRPRAVTDDDVERVITLTLETAPRDATHWSTRSMAQLERAEPATRSATSGGPSDCGPTARRPSSCRRTPSSSRRSGTPWGYTLNPPDRALVLCVDETSQIQALDRTRPLLPMRPGQVERRTHDYLRHGTTSLFAACRHQDRQSDWSLPPSAPGRRVPEIQRYHRGRGAGRPGRPPDRGQLRHPQDGADPGTWFAKRPRFHMHFTPTSASWLTWRSAGSGTSSPQSSCVSGVHQSRSRSCRLPSTATCTSPTKTEKLLSGPRPPTKFLANVAHFCQRTLNTGL